MRETVCVCFSAENKWRDRESDGGLDLSFFFLLQYEKLLTIGTLFPNFLF